MKPPHELYRVSGFSALGMIILIVVCVYVLFPSPLNSAASPSYHDFAPYDDVMLFLSFYCGS